MGLSQLSESNKKPCSHSPPTAHAPVIRRHRRTVLLALQLITKRAGLHRDKAFQGGTGAWRNSPLCSGQITPSCKWLWWQQGLYQATLAAIEHFPAVTGWSQQWDYSCTLVALGVSSSIPVSDLQPYQPSLMEPWYSVSFFPLSMKFQRPILLQYI